MERYDIAIIGTGPAGISAAITAKVRNKNIVLFGSGSLSDKLSKAHRIDNYPGVPAVEGKELADIFKKQIEDMGISIAEKKVNAVYAMGDYFSLQVGNEFVEAKTVIIATGVVFEKSLEGEEEYLGRGVSYCATCDGGLYKGGNVTVIGYSEESVSEAKYLATLAEKVTFVPMLKEKELLSEIEDVGNISILEEKPVGVVGGMKVQALKTEAGEYETDCVFILRDAIKASKLVPGIEMDGAHIKVGLSMETSIPGVFACGDVAGLPYQYIKAAGQGNIAALSAVNYLTSI